MFVYSAISCEEMRCFPISAPASALEVPGQASGDANVRLQPPVLLSLPDPCTNADCF